MKRLIQYGCQSTKRLQQWTNVACLWCYRFKVSNYKSSHRARICKNNLDYIPHTRMHNTFLFLLFFNLLILFFFLVILHKIHLNDATYYSCPNQVIYTTSLNFKSNCFQQGGETIRFISCTFQSQCPLTKQSKTTTKKNQGRKLH
jgi:prolipoprotein diacylglyceryltransferase